MTLDTDQRLERNLVALARRDRLLAERLCWPVDTTQVPTGDDGQVRLRLQQSLLPLQLSPVEVAAAVNAAAVAPGARPRAESAGFFVFGAGTGEIATALLRAHPDARVTVWDRDPYLLRLTLTRAELGEELASGRLRLSLGGDLFAELAGIAAQQLVFHPVLAQVYRNERALLDRAPATPGPGLRRGPVRGRCRGCPAGRGLCGLHPGHQPPVG